MPSILFLELDRILAKTGAMRDIQYCTGQSEDNRDDNEKELTNQPRSRSDEDCEATYRIPTDLVDSGHGGDELQVKDL
ncbi:hypothetical protein MRB53_041185 [Persea americana]|nr:hypothetical protein MRB53_041185 [Persea americana]